MFAVAPKQDLISRYIQTNQFDKAIRETHKRIDKDVWLTEIGSRAQHNNLFEVAFRAFSQMKAKSGSRDTKLTDLYRIVQESNPTLAAKVWSALSKNCKATFQVQSSQAAQLPSNEPAAPLSVSEDKKNLTTEKPLLKQEELDHKLVLAEEASDLGDFEMVNRSDVDDMNN
jgi:hypothetical protein